MGRGRRGTSSGKEKQTERSEREREGGGVRCGRRESFGGEGSVGMTPGTCLGSHY